MIKLGEREVLLPSCLHTIILFTAVIVSNALINIKQQEENNMKTHRPNTITSLSYFCLLGLEFQRKVHYCSSSGKDKW